MLDRVELAQNHVVLDALGLQGDNLLELRDGLIENIARARSRRAGAFPFSQLAQVDAPQQLVGVDVVGRRRQQRPRRHLGVVHAAGAEVEIGQGVVDLRRNRIGVQRQLVLLDGLIDLVRTPFGNGFVLVHAGQGQVIVGLRAIRRRGRRYRRRLGGRGRRSGSRGLRRRCRRGGSAGRRRGGRSGLGRPGRAGWIACRGSLSADQRRRQQKEDRGGNLEPLTWLKCTVCHHLGDSLRSHAANRVQRSQIPEKRRRQRDQAALPIVTDDFTRHWSQMDGHRREFPRTKGLFAACEPRPGPRPRSAARQLSAGSAGCP